MNSNYTKLKVYGENLDELFVNALKATFKLSQPSLNNIYLSKTSKRKVELESSSLTWLLADFLTEALYYSDKYKETYIGAKILELSEKHIVAEIYGKKILNFETKIKDVVNHGLVINKIYHYYEAVILFDI